MFRVSTALSLCVALQASGARAFSARAGPRLSMSLHDFSATTISGASKSLKDYSGKVVLIENVASL